MIITWVIVNLSTSRTINLHITSTNLVLFGRRLNKHRLPLLGEFTPRISCYQPVSQHITHAHLWAPYTIQMCFTVKLGPCQWPTMSADSDGCQQTLSVIILMSFVLSTCRPGYHDSQLCQPTGHPIIWLKSVDGPPSWPTLSAAKMSLTLSAMTTSQPYEAID